MRAKSIMVRVVAVAFTCALPILSAPSSRAQIFFPSTLTSMAVLTNSGETLLVGDKLFSNFGISGYNASNISVEGIEEDGGDYGIQFQGGFIATNNSLMDVHLTYQVNVEDSGSLISGANLSFNGAVVGPGGGLAEVVESVYTNTGYLYGQMVVSTTETMSQLSTNMVISPPQPQLNIDKDVEDIALTLSYASISTINQSFAQVPEPSTIILVGMGLLGVWGLRRRRG